MNSPYSLTTRRLLLAALVLACSILHGCGFASFDDISSSAPSSALVGKHFRSTKPLLIHQISMEQDYKPEPSVYVVHDFSVSGPEVISRSRLASGTTLTVVKVMRCTNCLFGFEERVHAVVQLTSTSQYRDREIQLPLELVGTALEEMAGP